MNSSIYTEAFFPAKLSAWRAAREFLELFCANAGVARLPTLRLSLILEELFTNTINHGHRGDSEFLVWISLLARESDIAVTYLDQSPPFNPLAMAKAQLNGVLEEREIGGLGVHLTTELTSASEYAYMYGRNRLRLVLPTPVDN